MSIVLISILTILLLSRVLQRRFSIPLPIGIMSLTLITYTYMPELINLSAHEQFDEILLLLLLVMRRRVTTLSSLHAVRMLKRIL